jgi:hypothetical protein
MNARVKVKMKTWFSVAAALLATGVFLCGLDFTQAAEPTAPVPVSAGAAPLPPPMPVSNKVRITFTTVPSQKAMVFWGRKRLGLIAPRAPLVVERPRDSGPLDVIVRAQGFLPVQTRAYTFADSKVAVKLTPPDQKKALLGYREAPPDGGAPPINPQGTPQSPGADGGAPR